MAAFVEGAIRLTKRSLSRVFAAIPRRNFLYSGRNAAVFCPLRQRTTHKHPSVLPADRLPLTRVGDRFRHVYFGAPISGPCVFRFAQDGA